MHQITHYTYRLLLICCLLTQLANCKKCRGNNPEEPSSSTSNASDTNNSGGTPPPPPSPITDAMIQEVIAMRKANKGYGWKLLEEVLKDLKNGNNPALDKKGKKDLTALHFAAWLGKPAIVQALLDRNADVNLKAKDSFTPFHVALVTNFFDAALLLLKSKKISKANLEADVINGKITALAYAHVEEAKGGADQAKWQEIIKELKAAEATK